MQNHMQNGQRAAFSVPNNRMQQQSGYSPEQVAKMPIEQMRKLADQEQVLGKSMMQGS